MPELVLYKFVFAPFCARDQEGMHGFATEANPTGVIDLANNFSLSLLYLVDEIRI